MINMDDLRERVDIVAVIGSRIPLTRRGQQYAAICPFHADKNPSFFVTPHKKSYYCFGCGATGDVVEFVERFDGIQFKEACELLQGPIPAPLPIRAGLKASTKELDWMSEVPPPAQDRPTSMSTVAHGDPVRVWAYKTIEGAVWGYGARYEIEVDGVVRKLVLQWTYGKSEGETNPRWACKHFSKLRPLYGLEHLYQADKKVMIVEGEKTAEAARQLFPTMLVLTWSGGAHGAKHSDWLPLAKRDCLIVPDADPTGLKAAQWIGERLTVLGCTVRMILPEPLRAKGWDLADALAESWTPTDAMRWATANTQPYFKEAVPVEVAPVVSTAPPSPFSEDNLAQRFSEKYAEDFRHVKVWGTWLRWQDHHWVRDHKDTVREAIRLLLCEAVNWEAGLVMPESGRRKINSIHMVKAVETFSQFNPLMAASADQWDANPWLLSTPDGTIDLKTGELRESRRSDYQLQTTAVTPSDGPCPTWLKFLDTVMDHDQDLISYLQRLMGYALTGLTIEQNLAFFYGTGGNGKGVFLSTIRAILGEYATIAAMSTFTESKMDRHPTDVAGLQGARLVMAQETEEGRRWAESLIKSLTGGDPIKARFMRQDYFEFIPKFKLVFAGNHKPALRSVDEAMRRRMHIVPWVVTIPACDRDPFLTDKLRAEHSAILRWIVEGCKEWQEIGLMPPAKILEATDEYMDAEDALATWLEENCTIAPEQCCPSKEAYQNYVEWCEKAKEFPWSHKRLISNLIARGMKSLKLNGIRSITGIGLKPVIPVQPVRTW